MTCVCDPTTWAETPGVVCDDFTPGVDNYCIQCGHDKGCHEVKDEPV
jgi:hypothetical protein